MEQLQIWPKDKKQLLQYWKKQSKTPGISNIHTFQPEVVYSQQGTQLANKETQRVNYLNIPVLGQLMFGRGFRYKTGPQLRLRTNATSHYSTMYVRRS